MDLKCRTCLERTTNRDRNLKTETELIAKIELLIGIQIAIREEYPSNICSICMEKIDDFIKFRYLVIETDSRIREFLYNNDNFQKTDIENDPFQDGLTYNSDLGQSGQTPTGEQYSQDNSANVVMKSEVSQNNIDKAIKIEAVVSDELEIKTDHGDKMSEILRSEEFLTNKIQSFIDEKPNVERTCRKYKCPDCIELFSYQRDCSNHRRKVHKKTCSVCGSLLRSDSMAKHMRSHQRDTIVGETQNNFQLQGEHLSQLHEDTIENDVIKSVVNQNNHTSQGANLPEEVCPNGPGFKVADVDNMSDTLCSNDILQSKYTCNYCGQVFDEQIECKRHKRKTHYRKTCNVCGFTCRSDDMNRHMLVHQKHQQQIECDQKNSEHKKIMYVDNMSDTLCSNDILETKYTCNYCGLVFDQRIECQRHKRKTHFLKTCSVCGITCRSDGMNRHMLVHQKHQQQIQSDHQKKSDHEKKSEHKKIDRKYKCQDCYKIFSQRREYKNHRKSVHLSKICTVCGTVLSSNSVYSHMLTHQGDRIACPICNKLLKHKNTLRVHMDMHKAMKYECEICERTYKFKSNLRKHRLQHEDPDKNKANCHICGKRVLVDSLKKHIMSHTGERPYPCKFCKKGFTTAFAVKVHLRQHTNERPYVCEFCSRGFSYKVSLLTHLKSKHGKV